MPADTTALPAAAEQSSTSQVNTYRLGTILVRMYEMPEIRDVRQHGWPAETCCSAAAGVCYGQNFSFSTLQWGTWDQQADTRTSTESWETSSS
jgi:hypothetical protein